MGAEWMWERGGGEEPGIGFWEVVWFEPKKGLGRYRWGFSVLCRLFREGGIRWTTDEEGGREEERRCLSAWRRV